MIELTDEDRKALREAFRREAQRQGVGPLVHYADDEAGTLDVYNVNGLHYECDLDALLMAVALALPAKAADEEEEPEGAPPAELCLAAPEDIAIAAVRATKKSIATAIRNLKTKGGET